MAVVIRLTDARLLTTTGQGPSRSESFVEVAHDALIAGWSVLRRWLEEDPASLRLQHRLTDAALEWVGNDHDPNYLYFGKRLDEANRWAEEHVDTVNTLEAEFLAESRARRWRFEIHTPYLELHILKGKIKLSTEYAVGLIASAALFLIASLILSLLYVWERDQHASTSAALGLLAKDTKAAQARWEKERSAAKSLIEEVKLEQRKAERKLGLSEARRLAALSEAVFKQDRSLAVLLAVEALNATKSSEPRAAAAEQALRDALSDSASRVLAGREQGRPLLDVSRHGRLLATLGPGEAVSLWDLMKENPAASPRVIARVNGETTALALAPDGRFLVTGSPDGEINTWELGQPNPTPKLLGRFAAGILAMAVNSDFLLIVVDEKGAAQVWSLLNPTASPFGFPAPNASISSVRINPERRLLAVGTREGQVIITHLANQVSKPLFLGGLAGPVQHLAISSLEHWLVAAGAKTVRLWDLSATNPSQAWVILGSQRGPVTTVALSDDEHWVVVGDAEGRAGLWSLTGGTPSEAPTVLQGSEKKLSDARFSPDSRWLALGGEDTIIRLWDLPGGSERPESIILSGAKGPVDGLVFSSDLRWLVTTSDECRIWPLRLDDLRELARRVAGRNLTIQEWARYFPDQRYRKTFPTLPGPAE